MGKCKNKITVKELCNVLELPRSTFYRWLQRTEDLKDGIEEKIKDVCLRHKFRYGYRRVTATLRKMGLCVNHKKVLRIMRQNHILSKVRRKKRIYQWCGANGSPSSIGAPIRCIQTK
ncbi:HTH-like domain protein [Bacillus cereus]|nr:HTH-like domain protein [Bacillus cereus]